MQPFSRHIKLDLHCLDTNSFIFSFKLIRRLIDDTEDFERDFIFSDLNSSQELHQEDNKKNFREKET